MASEASEASLRRKDSSGCSRRREEEGRKWVNGKGIEGAIAMAKRRRAWGVADVGGRRRGRRWVRDNEASKSTRERERLIKSQCSHPFLCYSPRSFSSLSYHFLFLSSSSSSSSSSSYSSVTFFFLFLFFSILFQIFDLLRSDAGTRPYGVAVHLFWVFFFFFFFFFLLGEWFVLYMSTGGGATSTTPTHCFPGSINPRQEPVIAARLLLPFSLRRFITTGHHHPNSNQNHFFLFILCVAVLDQINEIINLLWKFGFLSVCLCK